jgi:hypothetical protein
MSRRTVIRALKELYERCYIERWRRGLGKTNIYFVNPLAFVQSFKRPGRGQGVLLQAHGPEQRASAESTPAPDVTLSYKIACQNDLSRSAKPAQQQAPEWHTKHTKSEDMQGNDTYSNDSTAQKGTVSVAAQAIRREQQSNQPNGEETNTNPPSKSNNQPNDKKEGAAAERAGAVKAAVAEKQQGQPSARAAAIAEATGIPAAHLAELGIASEPRKRPIPGFITDIMTRYSRELKDSARSTRSNITRAAKMYYFGCDFIRDAQEDPEGWFIDLLYQAKQAAYTVDCIQYRNASNDPNRIPVFFTCLENRFEFTPDELVFLRSDLPLLAPEDR